MILSNNDILSIYYRFHYNGLRYGKVNKKVQIIILKEENYQIVILQVDSFQV